MGEYSGMTVNERLAVAGLLEDFDAAVDRAVGESEGTDAARQTAIDILRRVEFDAMQAAGTVDSLIANPTRYGFPRHT